MDRVTTVRDSERVLSMSPFSLFSTMLIAQVAADGGLAQGSLAQGTQTPRQPPAWVVEGVPDTVWILVEATYADVEDDLAKEMLMDAEDHARTAAQGYENDVGRRFALAVVLGRRADKEGGRTKIRVASEFHEELEAVLQLAPKHPQARHLMGRLYAGVRRMGSMTRWIATNLLGGGELKQATWEAAEAHLLFAEQAQPEVSDYHLQLARLYRDTDRPELALREVRHVFDLPVTTPLETAVNNGAVELELELTNGGPPQERRRSFRRRRPGLGGP